MAEKNYKLTVTGDSLDELIASLTNLLDELEGDDEGDDTDAKPAAAPKKKAAPKPAPVEEDDEDDDEDDEDDDGDEDDLEDYTESDLKALGIAELRKIADEEFEIDADGLKKAELIKEILDAQDEDSDDDDGDSDDDDDSDDEDDEGDDEGYTLEELQDMDLAELKAIAKEEGVSYGPRTKRDKLEAAVFAVVGVEDDE